MNKKNKNIFVVLTCLCVAVLLWFAYKSFFKQDYCQQNNAVDDTIIVGTNAMFAPFEFRQNGELVGFDIDLMESVAQKLGKKIVWKDIEFNMLLLEAQMGTIDIIASAMTPTEERAKQVVFTNPVLSSDMLVVVTKDMFQPKELKDLVSKLIVVNDGYTAESFMKEQQKVYPGIKLISLTTVAEAMLALISGRADAFVTAHASIKPFLLQHEHKNFYVNKLDEGETYAFAANKKSLKLIENINKILNKFEHDGTLKKLKIKWGLS